MNTSLQLASSSANASTASSSADANTASSSANATTNVNSNEHAHPSNSIHYSKSKLIQLVDEHNKAQWGTFSEGHFYEHDYVESIKSDPQIVAKLHKVWKGSKKLKQIPYGRPFLKVRGLPSGMTFCKPSMYTEDQLKAYYNARTTFEYIEPQAEVISYV